MTTILDIPDELLQEAMRHTGAKTATEAVAIALTELNQRRRLQELAEKLGTSEIFMTQDDLRRMREEQDIGEEGAR